MPLLALMYPSFSLAQLGDPLAQRPSEANGAPQAFSELFEAVQQQVAVRLARLPAAASQSGSEDESWYWAGPLLLDLEEDRGAAGDWLASSRLATDWAGEAKAEDDSTEAGEHSSWLKHLERFQRLARGEVPIGAPPKDLPAVLTLLAIAGPGVAALRALARVTGGVPALRRPEARLQAARIGWAFRTLFNAPEVMSLVRGMNGAEPYWRRVLEYCADGCLSAVLDEYAHVARESRGLAGHPLRAVVTGIGEEISDALSLRTSTLGVDEIKVENGTRVARESHRMRVRFAMRFGSEEADEGEERMRADHVRRAFNSPFWPFVLTTTSVGQEGLDFHQYCHAVVHWNLPASPVDFEQREGRVHRYKGHAVRKNVARANRTAALQGTHSDPWEAMFAAAVQSRPVGSNDLVPYWIYPIASGAQIERHVPILPLSREVERFAALRRSSAAYRMVFGQARQHDLLDFLLKQVEESKLQELCRSLQIDLSPPRREWPPASSDDAVLEELQWEEESGPGEKPKLEQLRGERLRRARQDSEYVRDLVAQCLPDEAIQRLVLEGMAETVRLAHELHPGSWSISLWGMFGDPLRVNVGPAEAVVLLPDGWLGIMADRATLGKPARDALRLAGAKAVPAKLRSIPGVTWIEIPEALIAELLPKVREGHEKYVRRATRRVRRMTRYAKFHAPGALTFFVAQGFRLPEPHYNT
jgi:hypothetical protein